MKIIKAAKKHINDLFAWRNDLHTRKMSMSSDLISFESHLIWYRSILDDKNQFLYIGLNEEDKIGFCRFNLNQKEMIAEVSLGLATKYLDIVLGKSVREDIKRGTALSWNFLK